MLILTRKPDEEIIIRHPDGSEVKIQIIEIRDQRVKLGFDAPTSILIHRKEVLNSNKPTT